MKFFGRQLEASDSTEALSVEEVRARGAAGRFLPLEEIAPLLCDPLTKAPLAREGERLAGGARPYGFAHGNPVLFPCDMDKVMAALGCGNVLQALPALEPVEQYCAFGVLKAAGNNNVINLDYADVWYGRHLFRATRQMQAARGRFLDIGCDDVFLSRGMLHPDVDYVGLEPSTAASAAVRVCGLGEFLPFADGSFDAVSFQTSLDHIMDYHLALAEARRVLRRGGRLYLSTLLWTERAQLYTDTVHFHHFRAGQVEAALADGFALEHADLYVWKNNTHRFGVYLSAVRT